MLTPRQESNLTSGGDCFEHWHSQDRGVDHDDLLTLQKLTSVKPISYDVTLDSRQDFVLVDTSAKNITVTLPLANNGREIEIMKNATANYVSVKPSGTDTILGAPELRMFSYGTSLRFKAIPNGWFIV